ncbi:MAG: 4-hydroxy-3-methylbut-2-enyl diphosphate reductase [Proteobacteria bacterium]|nr:4-hydroxy-3-methylbut-2-enyl diphosphate reductase [Pseudomonadota bacterium]
MRNGKDIYIYGDLIHNRIVMDELKKRGLKVIKSISEIPDSGTMVIRTHGVKPEVYDKAKEKGLKIVDLTCVFVKRSQSFARRIVEKGLKLIIIGEKNHDEILSIQGNAGGESIVINSVEEAQSIRGIERAGIVIQTTFERELAKSIIGELFDRTKYIEVYNTICDATEKRQESCKKLASQTDSFVVVGDENSSNTNRLYEIAKSRNEHTFMVADKRDIDCNDFKDSKTVGVTAGASTPDYIINGVIEKIGNS